MISLLVVIGLLGQEPVEDVSAFSNEDLVEREMAAVRALGTYKLRVKKNERKDGKMTGVQTMDVLIRPEPFAIVGDVVDGPSKGRKFLYNAALRKDELRVREAGFLGVVAIWVGIHSDVTRWDTNHPVTMLGLMPILQNCKTDNEKSKAAGGYKRIDEGMVNGARCFRFEAPAGVKGLYAKETRICVDPTSLLIKNVRSTDEKGVFEELSFTITDRKMKLADTVFTPEGQGL